MTVLPVSNQYIVLFRPERRTALCHPNGLVLVHRYYYIPSLSINSISALLGELQTAQLHNGCSF